MPNVPVVIPSPSDRPVPPSPLDMFRAKTVRQRIHPLEARLLWIVALQLVFLPWSLGGMPLWSEITSVALAAIALATSLVPRFYDQEISGQAPFRLYMWPKLVKFPIFWLGLLFLLYIVTQALNPAWQYMRNANGWWLERIDYNSSLPHGVASPFTIMNQWRAVLIYGAAWLTTCAAWVGFTRRRSLQILFGILAVNAGLLALLGLAERGLNAKLMFWFWKPPAAYFVSSFIYKNHAGAYFNLMLAICAGSAYWYYTRAERRLEKSNPSPVFAFFAVLVVLVILISYSRTATALMFVFCALGVLGFFAWQRRNGIRFGSVIIAVLLFAGFGVLLKLALYSEQAERIFSHMQAAATQVEAVGTGDRALARSATRDLFSMEQTYGWGAGSFRFAFPITQRYYPTILTDVHDANHHYYWEHAHNDYFELLAEFGFVGAAIPALMLLYWLFKLVRVYFWENGFVLPLAVGCCLTLVHSWVDFNFHNPAILVTWCVLWPTMIRWAELEESRSR